MLLPMIMADVIANIASNIVMADVIAKMSYLYYNHQCWYLYGRCYCQVADGIATLIIVLADVIAKWQMEWPLQGWSIGRCYCHVADGIATGSYYLKFKFWGVKQNLIPYVRQMVLTYVSI